MRRPLRIIALCAALAACLAATAPARGGATRQHVETSAAAWKKLAPAGGGFSVLIPGTASQSASPVKTGAIELQNHLFTMETPLAAYIVSYIEFPEPVTDPDAIKNMLDSGRDGGIDSTKATLSSEKDIKLGAHHGREWVMAVQGKFVAHARAYWVERRLYQLLIVMMDAPANAPAADLKVRADATAKFFDSFALTPAAAPGTR